MDKDTGLPELPDGYVWRVREGTFSGLPEGQYETLVVEVCRRSWWGLSMVVSDNLMDWAYSGNSAVLSPKAPTPENIRACAVKVHREFERMLEVQGKLLAERTARQKLVGTYPPKKLN